MAKSPTSTGTNSCVLFFKWLPLMDMSCISVAPLRTIHELILSKFVCRIFFDYVTMVLGVM